MLVYRRVDHCWCFPPKESRTFLKICRIDGRFPSHPLVIGMVRGIPGALGHTNGSLGLNNNVYTTGDLKGLHQMDISENSGTPKSSILIGFSIILNHPFWGCFPYFLETPKLRSGKWFPHMHPFLRNIWIPRVQPCRLRCPKKTFQPCHLGRGAAPFWTSGDWSLVGCQMGGKVVWKRLDVTGSFYSKWFVNGLFHLYLVNGVFRGVISYNPLILTFYTFPGTSN